VCEVARFLQVVGVGDVPLHGVVDGVVALEEILASFKAWQYRPDKTRKCTVLKRRL